MQFQSVWNLPERAKVRESDGDRRRGVKVTFRGGWGALGGDVDVTARSARRRHHVGNPRGFTQQATVRGDIYVALERPPAGPTPAPQCCGGVIRSTKRVPATARGHHRQLAKTSSQWSFNGRRTPFRLNRGVPSSDGYDGLTTRSTRSLGPVRALDQVDQRLPGWQGPEAANRHRRKRSTVLRKGQLASSAPRTSRIHRSRIIGVGTTPRVDTAGPTS